MKKGRSTSLEVVHNAQALDIALDGVRKRGEQAMGSHEAQAALLHGLFCLQVPALFELLP